MAIFHMCAKDILEILKAYKRIGLTVNENHIMIPRKSVTAVISLKKGKMRTKINAAGVIITIACIEEW